MAMVVSIPKIFVLVFKLASPGPYQWTINGAALMIVSQVKYLGLLFHSEAAFSPSFAKPQAEDVRHLGSIAATVWTTAVPVVSGPAVPHLHGLCVSHNILWTISYGCEGLTQGQGHCRLQAAAAASRQCLAKSHLHTVAFLGRFWVLRLQLQRQYS